MNKELMTIAWYPKQWQNFCISEDEKKEIEPIFTKAFNVYNLRVLKLFSTSNLCEYLVILALDIVQKSL